MTSQKLNKEHEILSRFMGVVVSSTFWDSPTLWIDWSSDSEFVVASVFDSVVLTVHLSPNVALECSFKHRFSPEIEKGSSDELKAWSLNRSLRNDNKISRQ